MPRTRLSHAFFFTTAIPCVAGAMFTFFLATVLAIWLFFGTDNWVSTHVITVREPWPMSMTHAEAYPTPVQKQPPTRT